MGQGGSRDEVQLGTELSCTEYGEVGEGWWGRREHGQVGEGAGVIKPAGTGCVSTAMTEATGPNLVGEGWGWRVVCSFRWCTTSAGTWLSLVQG